MMNIIHLFLLYKKLIYFILNLLIKKKENSNTMNSQNTIFYEIEKYIRNMVAQNNGSFNRDAILIQSKDWMEKYPVEFNSILNMIENERKSGYSDFMDDSTPSVAYGGGFVDDSTPSIAYGGGFVDDSTPSIAYGGGFVDDSTPSVAYGSGFADDSTPSVAYGGGFADDSTPSVAYGGGFADDSTPSVAYGGGFADDSMPSFYHTGSIYAADETPNILPNQDDPMGSDEVDSSPNGNQDDDEFDSYMPLQRTMSSLPPRK